MEKRETGTFAIEERPPVLLSFWSCHQSLEKDHRLVNKYRKRFVVAKKSQWSGSQPSAAVNGHPNANHRNWQSFFRQETAAIVPAIKATRGQGKVIKTRERIEYILLSWKRKFKLKFRSCEEMSAANSRENMSFNCRPIKPESLLGIIEMGCPARWEIEFKVEIWTSQLYYFWWESQ